MAAADSKATAEYDVTIVGYGPVGQMLAARLGRAGFSVAVFERQASLYKLSRAVHCDDEIVRLLQDLGVAEDFVADSSPLLSYDWYNGEEELLVHLNWSEPGPSGWLGHYFYYQPRLETLLDEVARACEGVDVWLGWEGTALRQDSDGVELTVRERGSGEERTVRSRYVVGADGANSFVREAIGSSWIDFGFNEDWLVADLRPHDPDVQYPMIESGQICDPARPTTMFRWMGRSFCRWEFMRLPGEDADELADEASVWRLVERWGPTPQNADLVRHTVYTFRSRVADRWRDGRILLAGDAAHLMPPFLGQGLASGFRDAVNIAWKLELMLTGRCGSELLASYQVERGPHVTELIKQSIAFGQIVCISDPDEARERDQLYLSGNAPPPPPFPVLTDGVLFRPEGSSAGGAGTPALQARVSYGGASGRFDDVVGRGWIVLWRRGEPLAELDEGDRELLEQLGATTVQVTPAPLQGCVIDLEHLYDNWFSELGVELVIIRPDHNLFGGVASSAELPVLLSSLRQQLAYGLGSAGPNLLGSR